MSTFADLAWWGNRATGSSAELSGRNAPLTPALSPRLRINSYVAAARHFALGDTAIYGLLRLI